MKYFLLLFIIFLVAGSSFGQVLSGEFFRRQVEVLYRKPTKSELNNVAVDPILFEKYKSFLNAKDTGLIRLMSDKGCSSSNKIVVASEYCLTYSMPGNGSAYSFRFENYRIRHLADLAFKDNVLYSGGRLTLSAMANLGNKDINSITQDSESVKEIAELMPETDFDIVVKQVERLKKGVTINNIFFSNKLSAEKNSTYILRSVAFGGNNFVAIKGFTYNEFDYDKRRDIIIAFRVVEKNNDGSVVLLWKELRNEKAPKIKFRK
jgi:hypothetical protein